MHSKWINGNLAFWDTHEKRILKAIGPTVNAWELNTKHVDTDGTTTLDGYTVTLVETGAGNTHTITVGASVPGNLTITTDNADNDGYNIQLYGEPFKLTGATPCYFGIKLKVGDATQTDFLVGLCITDTDLLGAMTDGVYFRKVDASTTCNFVLEKNSTETATAAATIADDTFVTLEWYYDGTYVDFFVDGVAGTRPAVTNLVGDEELTPSIHFLTGEADTNILTIEWARAIQFN
jgi:hypothetical protein